MYENNITPHGERIRSIRKRRGMSQKELARAAGLSLSWVKKQEQGDGGTPTTETMHKVAVALEVQTSTLISEVRPGPPHPHTAEDWAEVRDALHGRGPQPEPGATAHGITEALDAMRPALAANKYSAVRALLPGLIRDAATLDARPARRPVPRPEPHRVAAHPDPAVGRRRHRRADGLRRGPRRQAPRGRRREHAVLVAAPAGQARTRRSCSRSPRRRRRNPGSPGPAAGKWPCGAVCCSPRTTPLSATTGPGTRRTCCPWPARRPAGSAGRSARTGPRRGRSAR